MSLGVSSLFWKIALFTEPYNVKICYYWKDDRQINMSAHMHLHTYTHTPSCTHTSTQTRTHPSEALLILFNLLLRLQHDGKLHFMERLLWPAWICFYEPPQYGGWHHQERRDLRVQWKQINSQLNLAIRRWDVEKMAKKKRREKN